MKQQAWLMDDKGNRCSAKFFGSYQKAQAALQSLINCRDCVNCVDCKNCANCEDCENCTDCSKCYDCAECSNCTSCRHCGGCKKCISCSNCSFAHNEFDMHSTTQEEHPVKDRTNNPPSAKMLRLAGFLNAHDMEEAQQNVEPDWNLTMCAATVLLPDGNYGCIVRHDTECQWFLSMDNLSSIEKARVVCSKYNASQQARDDAWKLRIKAAQKL